MGNSDIMGIITRECGSGVLPPSRAAPKESTPMPGQFTPSPRPIISRLDDPTVALVPLTRGMVAVIDAADAAVVGQHCWRAVHRNGTWYAVATVRGRGIYLHRFLLDLPRGVRVDHEDRDGLNNRRGNLRSATVGQNMANSKMLSSNTSGYRGVSWHAQRRRWVAYIKHEQRTRYLGLFDSAEDAARAYDAAAQVLHGEFASLNFVALEQHIASKHPGATLEAER